MIANSIQRQNSIFSLTINNVVIYDQHKIHFYILEYYKNLLGTSEERLITINTHL
jgi:hypothetical protein